MSIRFIEKTKQFILETNATVYQNLFGQAKNAYESLFFNISENREIPDVVTTHCELVMKNNLYLYE